MATIYAKQCYAVLDAVDLTWYQVQDVNSSCIESKARNLGMEVTKGVTIQFLDSNYSSGQLALRSSRDVSLQTM